MGLVLVNYNNPGFHQLEFQSLLHAMLFLAQKTLKHFYCNFILELDSITHPQLSLHEQQKKMLRCFVKNLFFSREDIRLRST